MRTLVVSNLAKRLMTVGCTVAYAMGCADCFLLKIDEQALCSVTCLHQNARLSSREGGCAAWYGKKSAQRALTGVWRQRVMHEREGLSPTGTQDPRYPFVAANLQGSLPHSLHTCVDTMAAQLTMQMAMMRPAVVAQQAARPGRQFFSGAALRTPTAAGQSMSCRRQIVMKVRPHLLRSPCGLASNKVGRSATADTRSRTRCNAAVPRAA